MRACKTRNKVGAEAGRRLARFAVAARLPRPAQRVPKCGRTALWATLLVLLGASVQGAGNTRPNVLFIVADDLNHWVGHLGRHPQAYTPNLDRLARMGVTFTAANCPAPACNPSRTAVLSGRRPSTTGIYDNGQSWSPYISREEVLTTQFLGAGYRVVGAGKVFHGSARREGEWTDYFIDPNPVKLRPHSSAKPDGGEEIFRFGPLENRDDDLPDYRNVSYGIEQLKAEHRQPLFLAVGLIKPHMPFSVPKAWFDQFPLESIQLPPHQANDLDDVPAAAKHLTKYPQDHAVILKSGRWKEAVQAYLAAIAFCDAQLGRLLDALEASAYRDNTIVCFWGDHGWHLGEKNRWRKFTLWEEGVRSAFIWKVPGVTAPGGVCDRPVDFMSIYPTLCDLANIPKPAHVEGLNIRRLLANPRASWEHPALTTYQKNNHSLRTCEWRYTRYADGSEELYHHPSDPYEWKNVAGDSRHAALKRELARHFPATNAVAVPRDLNGDEGSNKKSAR